MTILILSFIAGILTILAPCVLPLLPVILGASVEDSKEKYRPYIIIAALSLSIIIFSLALKATTLFIGFDTKILTGISGIIIILFGLITLFPDFWKKISSSIMNKSSQQLGKSSQKKGAWGSILIGFSLGPVFSSCSPTYALILAVILPISFFFGFINLLAYTFGLALMLLLIAKLGQKFSGKLRGISDPHSKFKKGLGILFLLVGLAIFTGFDKTIEAKLIEKGFLGATNIEFKFQEKLNQEIKDLESKTK